MSTFKIKDKETGKVFTVREKEEAALVQQLEQPNQQEDQTFLNTPAKERVISGMTGGIIPAVGGAKDAEKTAPAIGGILGGVVGARLGKPNVGAAAGAFGGKLYEDSVKKLFRDGDDFDVRDAIMVGGLYGLGGKAFDSALKGLGVSAKIIPEASREKFFQKALQAVNVGRQALSRNFGRSINELAKKYPERTVDLSGVASRLKNQFDVIDETIVPQLKTAVKNNPKLLAAIDDPALVVNLPLKDALEFKNAVTSATNSITNKAIKGKNTPNERVVFDIIDDIDDAITSKFKEMYEVRRIYAQGKRDFDLARPLVEPGKSVEANIFNKPTGAFGVGGSPFMGSVMGKRATQRVMGMTPAGEKMFKAAELAHKLNRAADSIYRMGLYAAGASGASMLLGKKKMSNG